MPVGVPDRNSRGAAEDERESHDDGGYPSEVRAPVKYGGTGRGRRGIRVMGRICSPPAHLGTVYTTDHDAPSARISKAGERWRG
jgi:hypothetical protein